MRTMSQSRRLSHDGSTGFRPMMIRYTAYILNSTMYLYLALKIQHILQIFHRQRGSEDILSRFTIVQKLSQTSACHRAQDTATITTKQTVSVTDLYLRASRANKQTGLPRFQYLHIMPLGMPLLRAFDGGCMKPLTHIYIQRGFDCLYILSLAVTVNQHCRRCCGDAVAYARHAAFGEYSPHCFDDSRRLPHA